MRAKAGCALAVLVFVTWAVPGRAQTCLKGFCFEAIPSSDRSFSRLETGDFNGDGELDLLGLDYNRLYLLTGTGGGHFAPFKMYQRQEATQSVAVADIDGDGRSDVAVTNTGPFNDGGQSVSIYRGMADGTLGPPLNLATAAKPRSVAFAEVIGGAGIDLVVCTESNRRVSVFPGNGDGTFGAAVTGTSTIFAGTGLLARDINQDGRVDLVFGGSLALGNGDGTFGPQSAVGPGLLFSSPQFAHGDWDRDGKLDLALAGSGADDKTGESVGSIAVLLGNGDGTFEVPLDYAPLPGSSSLDIGAGDLTGDGVPDLAALTSYPNYSISILVGRGDGTFGMKQDLSLTVPTAVMAFGDLDRDGRLDLAISWTGTTALLNRGFTPTPDNAPAVFAPAEVAASAYDPVAIKVVASDPDLDPLLSLTADLSGLPTGNNATFSASRQSYTGVLNWTPRATDAGTHRITFTVTNALTVSATTLVHVVRGSGAPGGQLFQSFYQTFDAGNVRDLAVADIDRDGRVDVLTVGSEGLSVLPGRGDGTFSAPRISSPEVFQFLLDDVNGDGLMDAVGASASPSRMVTYLASGDGSFAPGIPFEAGAAGGTFAIGNARIFALADLDRDLKTDLIVLNGDLAVAVLLGNGDGTFRDFRSYPAGTRPESISAWDVNHDGVKDLVVVEAFRGIAIMISPGDGTLQPPVEYSVPGAFSVASGDVNADGHPDLSIAQLEDGFTVLLGSGDGSFRQGTASGGVGDYRRVALADMNGDGRDDVIAPDISAGTFNVFFTGPDGSLGQPRRTPSIGGDSPLVPANLNGDGFLDLVTGSANRIVTFTGNGDGTFGTGTQLSVGAGARVVALERLNSDAFLDLAVAHEYYQAPFLASVLLGHGDGTFGAKTEYETGRTSYGMSVGDLNGDGSADLVVSNLQEYENAASVLLGNGDGTFQPQRRVEVGPGPYSTAIGDFNRDGSMDLAVANFPLYASGVRLVLGNGDGTFQPPVLLQSIGNALSVAAGDLDGDGILDIAATEGANNPCSRGCGHTIFLLFGNGDGTFRSGARLGTPIESEEVLIQDVNQDGKADLVLKTYTSVCVFLGTGGGGFLDHQDFAIGAGLSGIAIGDVDGDGVKDVVTANSYDSSVSVLLGSGGGSFGRRHDFGPGPAPSSIALGDVNGDSRPDLVVGSELDHVSILLNLGPAPPPSLSASLILNPHVLNLKSHGQDMTAYIELAVGVSPASIDIATVRLDGQVPARGKTAQVGDHDFDGIPDLMLKFDRAALLYLEPGERNLTLSGSLMTGESFECSAMIRVIHPGSGQGKLLVRVVSPAGASNVTIVSVDEPGAAHTIEVFDVQGRLVRRWSTLAGEAELRASWDGRRADGARCGSGIYFIRVAAAGRRGDGRAIIVR